MDKVVQMGQKWPKAEAGGLCNSEAETEESRNKWIKMLHYHRTQSGGSRGWSSMFGLNVQWVIGRNLDQKLSFREPGWLACGSSPALDTNVGNLMYEAHLNSGTRRAPSHVDSSFLGQSSVLVPYLVVTMTGALNRSCMGFQETWVISV